MIEKIYYNNWVTEELKIKIPKINDNQIKEDLFYMKMSFKLKEWWFIEEDLEGLNTKYFNEIGPIVSAMDYENISDAEIINMIDEIEDISKIDKRLIYILIFGYYKNLE